MAQIISFLLSVIFVLDMFFVGLIPEKQLVITQTVSGSEYCINGESDGLRFGVADAATIACKALYTRPTGAKGFVSFAFRKTVTPENDINNFAFFNEYLQPAEAVITYATVIRFLGNADFVRNISNEIGRAHV